ncbi:hypothetical protein GCM10022243_26010 [Saccharothrix violaceirubra]|uniref:ESAT-6 protein secretion system EspG family protein n=1 Tax=Saccharothrix violaceirubra TaxID=413306 RepID=A0A7W7T5Z9_9PSEU|nr:hypothetical protein [Saccharothrix violaceirubra]MBB4967206.1 hypothetical protein [Saccharothrix violaceirubra]
MVDPLALSRAEVEFLLRVRPPALDSLRTELHLAPADADAGGRSLTARGLCRFAGGRVVFAAAVAAVADGLSRADRLIRLLGWDGDRPVVAHLLTGPGVHIGLVSARPDRFTAHRPGRAESLRDQVARFLDRHLTGKRRSTLLVRTAGATGSVDLAVAVDDDGTWSMSDTLASPTRTSPSSRDLAVARIAELVTR